MLELVTLEQDRTDSGSLTVSGSNATGQSWGKTEVWTHQLVLQVKIILTNVLNDGGAPSFNFFLQHNQATKYYLNEGTGDPCTGQTKQVSSKSWGVSWDSVRLALLGEELPIGSVKWKKKLISDFEFTWMLGLGDRGTECCFVSISCD